MLCLILIMNEFNTSLLVLLSQQIRGLFDKSLATLQLLLELLHFREEANIIFGIKLALLK